MKTKPINQKHAEGNVKKDGYQRCCECNMKIKPEHVKLHKFNKKDVYCPRCYGFWFK